MIKLIGGFVNTVSAAVLREVIHKRSVNAAAVTREMCRLRLQLRPFIEGELVAEVEDSSYRRLSAPVRRLGPSPVPPRYLRLIASVCMAYNLRSPPSRSPPASAAFIVVHARARPYRAIPRRGNVGQFLCAASRLIKRNIRTSRSPRACTRRPPCCAAAASRNTVFRFTAAVAGIFHRHRPQYLRRSLSSGHPPP